MVQQKRRDLTGRALTDVDASLDAGHARGASIRGATVLLRVVHSERLLVLRLEHADRLARAAAQEVATASVDAVDELRCNTGLHRVANEGHAALHHATAAALLVLQCLVRGHLQPTRQKLGVKLDTALRWARPKRGRHAGTDEVTVIQAIDG